MQDTEPLTEREDAIRRTADATASAIRDTVDPDGWADEAAWFAPEACKDVQEREGVDVTADRMESEIRKRLGV